MATDGWSIVQFNDGEGVDHNDFNKVGRRERAFLTNVLLERLTGRLAVNDDPELWSQNDGFTALNSVIYTLTAGDCYLQSTSGTQVAIRPGTIFQKVGGTSVEESAFLAYDITLAAHSFTIAAGDATNPRVDIVQVKLELESGNPTARDFKDAVTGALSSTTPDKDRRVKATISVKQGVPSATPQYPAPDAGYAILAAVRVPATWTTGIDVDAIGAGGTTAIIRHCAIPLGIEAVTVMPGEFDYESGTAANWSRDANGVALAGAGAVDLHVWAPGGSQAKRIVGIEIVGVWVTSGDVRLRTIAWNSATNYTPSGVSCDLSPQLVTTGGTTQSKFAHLGDIAEASDATNPSAVDGPVGDPFWCGGGVSGPAHRKLERNGANLSGASWFSRAALLIDGGSGTKIVSVTFYLAGGVQG